MSDMQQIIGEHEARLAALEHSEDQRREDFIRLFNKLDEMNENISTLKAQSHCPDPGACMRLERVMTEYNRRIWLLENAEAKRIGAMAVVGTVFTVIGLGIGWAISLFNK